MNQSLPARVFMLLGYRESQTPPSQFEQQERKGRQCPKFKLGTFPVFLFPEEMPLESRLRSQKEAKMSGAETVMLIG